MSVAETARLIGEILAVLMVLAGGFRWIVRSLWRAHAKLDQMGDQLRQINGSVKRHDEDLQQQKELNAWFSGVLGEPKPTRRDGSE